MSTGLDPRRAGVIGGSEIARALGVSGSRLKLWAEKCGLVEPADLDDLPRVRAGKTLEVGIARWYEEQTGNAVALHEPNWIQHSQYPFLGCSPDGTVTTSSGEIRGLEIKYVSADQAKRWDEEPPLAYSLQSAHNLMCLADWDPRIERLDLAAFVAGFSPYLMVRTIERDPDLERIVTKGGREFWDLVERREEPPADHTDESADTIKRMFPKTVEGHTAELPADVDAWSEELLDLAARRRPVEKREAELKNLIRQAMGEAEYGTTPGGVVWTLKTQFRKPTAASEFRVLRRKGGAE